MNKKVECYHCKNTTDEPVKVKFYGWTGELSIPAQINLCPRCNEQWVSDIERRK